jgi:uncharacterized membrane protein YdbT with pleckstrin-like domain
MMEKAIVSIIIGAVVGSYTERNKKNFWGGAAITVILTLVACAVIDLL